MDQFYIEEQTKQPFDGPISSIKRLLAYNVPETAPLLKDLELIETLEDGTQHYVLSEDGQAKLHYYKNFPLTEKVSRQENRWRLDTSLVVPGSLTSDRSYTPVMHGYYDLPEDNQYYNWVVPFVNYEDRTIDFPKSLPDVGQISMFVDFWKFDESLMLSSHVENVDEQIKEILKEIAIIDSKFSSYTVDGGEYW